ncbi:unnamed protein product [Paramecium primaurelia]|uniref:Uncharacterized protein n=1 Tax=Paramecium primaurelia TaxID=5886 RepID=A0A8S1KVF8_PARPR|nr:unnamed protein product [Paramecium primaurelia]
MNLQTQSEIDLKLSALDKLGDNPDEVDIKYVSYILKIPLQTIRQWLEERVEQDFQIDLSNIEDTECQLIGSNMKNKELINQQNLVKDEDIQQKQINTSFKQSSIDLKDNQVSKQKKIIDKNKQSYTDKIIEKDQKKQNNLIFKQSQQISYEDCKTQENKNINQLIKELANMQNDNISISQNIDDNQDQLEQLIQQNKQNQNLIHLEKEKDQQGMSQIKLIEQQNNEQQQSKSLIFINDQVNQQNQIIKNSKKEKKQKQTNFNINDKQLTLQDLTHLKKKKIKNPIQQKLFEIGQNQKFQNGIIKQSEQKQNIIQMNLTKKNQLQYNVQQKQDQNSLYINQQQSESNLSEGYQKDGQIINSTSQSHEQSNKQKQQVEIKTSNNQHQFQTQPHENTDYNSAIESIKQQQKQSYSNGVNCTSHSMTQNNLSNSINQSSQKFQNKELQFQNDSELNPIYIQSNNIIQGSVQQKYMDKIQQIPYQFEMIQMFNNNSQALGQVIKLITAVSNYQIALIQKLDMIYECVNKK